MSSAELAAVAPKDTDMDIVVAVIMIVAGAWACRHTARPITHYSHIGVGIGGMVALFGVLKLGFALFG